ncbi:DUF6053 domain-containing protein [Lysobacter enzymogenes]|uniref:DUF6053 domain-containing protein n=1 Tax=Lysobacter enzymogenes TaxID=69 RepID=UPI00339204C8
MLSAQMAGILIATGAESIGAEAPPTKAEQCGSLLSFLWERLKPRGSWLRWPESSSQPDRKASGLKPLPQKTAAAVRGRRGGGGERRPGPPLSSNVRRVRAAMPLDQSR